MSHKCSSPASEAVRKAASVWIARRDAGLSAAEAAEFQTWREASPRHAEALARYEKLWSHLDRPRAAGASPQVNRDLALLRQRDRRRRSRWASTASLLVVVSGAVWWAARHAYTLPLVEPDAVVVMVPERRMLTDGTIIEYPAGSALRVDFSSPGFRRVTLLRGEAHLQVASNAARPFVVRAAGVDIEAVGTAFGVQVAKAAVVVVVTEGRVAVGHADSRTAPPPDAGTAMPSRTLVNAGQKLSVSRGAAELRVEAISPTEVEQQLAWRNPRMEFSDAPLRDVVAAINRYAAERGGVQFVFADPVLKSTRLSGIFRVDEASAFVAILEKGFGIETERSGEQTLILRKRR